jgi:hypothetical protein
MFEMEFLIKYYVLKVPQIVLKETKIKQKYKESTKNLKKCRNLLEKKVQVNAEATTKK